MTTFRAVLSTYFMRRERTVEFRWGWGLVHLLARWIRDPYQTDASGADVYSFPGGIARDARATELVIRKNLTRTAVLSDSRSSLNLIRNPDTGHLLATHIRRNLCLPIIIII